jgi:glucan-binding YG repeat protein/GH25 family lysozyme M1 (1,4-beta-N-acetylmuramidase)
MSRSLLSKPKYGGLLAVVLVVVMACALATPVAAYGVEPQEAAENFEASQNADATQEPQEELIIEDGDTTALPLAAAGEQFEDGHWYFYDAAGNRVPGWVDLPDGRHVFYTDESGMLRYGMHQVGDEWYYFGPDGNMYADHEVSVNGYWYYFGTDGKRVAAWTDLLDGRHVFYTNATGMLRNGMYQVAGDWYYFGTSGVVYTGREVSYNGCWYYLNADGKRAQAWTDLPDGRHVFYTNVSGMLCNGMYQVGDAFYFFGSNGDMYRGREVQVGGRWFYVESDGTRKDGWKEYSTKKVYYDGSNGMATGEFAIGGNSYFFSPANGAMMTGTVLHGDYRYEIGNDGVIISKTFIGSVSTGSVRTGIDVSYWQGTIDWSAVRASGVDFAMIRAGWFAADSPVFNLDSTFARNVIEAKRNGIQVGVYIYVYSYSTWMLDQGVNMFHNSSAMDEIRAAGITFDFPVYLDFEDSLFYSGTGGTGGYQARTDIIAHGMDLLRYYGYRAGFYTFYNWAVNEFNGQGLIDYGYSFWLAKWYSNNSEEDPYRTDVWENANGPSIWQYRSTGSVPGVSGNVDKNYMYVEIMRKYL